MHRGALLIAFCLVPGAALRAQDEAAPKPAGEHAGHQMNPSPARADVAVEWTKVQDHWRMVQSLSGPQKAEHLEMHRSMLDGLMSDLAAHAAPPGGVRKGRAPTVGDRMEKADPAPVPPEREAPLEDEAMSADAGGKTGERIDEKRTAKAEAGAETAGEGGRADLAELQSHWAMVEGVEDPAELEKHLAMHMEMLGTALDPARGGAHEGKRHGARGARPATHEGRYEPDGG